jgi:adenylate cyclase
MSLQIVRDEHGRLVAAMDPSAREAGPQRIDPMLWLWSLGLGIADIRSMATVPARQIVDAALNYVTTRTLTLKDIADRAGMTVDELESFRKACGLPTVGHDDIVFGAEEVELYRLFHASTALFSSEEMHHFGHVLGSAVSRVVDAALAMFRTEIEVPMTEAGATPLELARYGVEGLYAFEALAQALPNLMWSHVLVSADRERSLRQTATALDTVPMAVGFVDLVGFTPLSSSLGPRELDRVIREFEQRSYDILADHNCRVVKLIGDEVMFVGVTATDACNAAMGLIEGFARGGDGLCVTPRGGVAFGELVSRGGDYYGSVVNIAARIADLAVPMELLVTTDVVDQVVVEEGKIDFDPAGRRQLKGFSDPVPLASITSAIEPCS